MSAATRFYGIYFFLALFVHILTTGFCCIFRLLYRIEPGRVMHDGVGAWVLGEKDTLEVLGDGILVDTMDFEGAHC